MRLAVTAEAGLWPEAEALAQRLALPLYRAGSPPALLLRLSAEGLALMPTQKGLKPLAASFDTPELRRRLKQAQCDPLARAVGLKGSYRPTVIDATAGLGHDALLLAAAGCQVMMLERSPVVAALLEAALARRYDPAIQAAAERLTLLVGDARALLAQQAAPEVIYLDPMYPAGKGAAKRKGMALLRQLVGGDEDAGELLTLALARARRRVVVKRPLKAPPLGGQPVGALRGHSVRFDIYHPA